MCRKISDKISKGYIEEIHRGILNKIEQGSYNFDWQVPIAVHGLTLTKIDKFLIEKKYQTRIVTRETFGEDCKTYNVSFLIIEWKRS